MSLRGINPVGMTVRGWCDQMTIILESSGPVPQLTRDDWKAWARHVIQLPKITTRQPPDPGSFEDWRAWAQRFNEVIA
jgi:hypothetical protein